MQKRKAEPQIWGEDQGTRRRKERQRRQRRRRRQVLFWKTAGLLISGAVLLVSLQVLPGGKKAKEAYLLKNGYPESLIALYDRNPEARTFVLDYLKREQWENSVDLSGEVVCGTIPLFLQWDERWGYETYGDDFLAVTGCGPTSLSMVYCGLTGDTWWNPGRMAQKAEDEGYYVEGAGSSWSLMTDGARSMGLTVEGVNLDRDSLETALKNQMPVICSVEPGDFTTEGHFLVMTGIDDAGKISVNDPNSRRKSQKTWEIDRMLDQIKAMWAYLLLNLDIQIPYLEY